MSATSDGPATERLSGVNAAISREVVAVLKDLTGRGPTKARTHVHDDSVIVLLREGHTKSEETMFDSGGSRAVAQGRVDLSEGMRERLSAAIEGHTGRRVVGFLSSSQQDPSLISFVFVLETSPLLGGVDGDRAD